MPIFVLQSLLLTCCCLFVRSRFWIKVLSLILGLSLTASFKTMSVWNLLESQFGGEESAEQQSEEGAETRENDDPNAYHEFEAGLEQQDRDGEKDGHEEGRVAEATEEEEEKEEEKQDEDE